MEEEEEVVEREERHWKRKHIDEKAISLPAPDESKPEC